MRDPEHEFSRKFLGNLRSFFIRSSGILGLLVKGYGNLFFQIVDNVLCQNRKSAVKVIEFVILLANISGEDHLKYLRQNIINRILIGLIGYIGLIDYLLFFIICEYFADYAVYIKFAGSVFHSILQSVSTNMTK